ncbi:MAG: magnesium transporter [Colwellia polaris]|jgi:magnesium transporter|uniref:magnesium transporter n=1 Tax=Colwellia polaris TaxID=326537 RepID=UPI000A1718B1|nr:magnesium transporter [Colwellia polaris]|tara:strand:+ start:21144 stop:22496 length:1353 start_codon:yes stop_codon:yes gene_type:complete
MLENTIDKLSLVIDDILIAEHEQDIAQIMLGANETLVAEQFALLIEALPQDKRLSVWATFSEDIQKDAFVDMGQGTRTSLIQALSDDECFELLAQLDVDDVIEIAEEIPSRLLKYAIKNLDDSQRKLYQQAQQYTVDEVGHWLDYNYVRISEKLKITSAQLLLQKGLSPYTEDFYAVNKEGILTGTVDINSLIQSDGENTLKTLFAPETIRLSANEELTSAAEAVILSGKMSLPVVDENERFLGRFTVETAYQVKQETQTEQINSAAGLTTDEDLFSSVRTSAKNRGIWLGINLLTAFLASWFIGFFEATLQQVVALAVLMPVVASMGGVSGSQTLTVIVRGMALGQITEQNRKVLLRKELKVGGLNGIIWSVVIGTITYFWFNNAELSLVIALAILLNLLTASASGVVIPAILDKLNIDPALSGSVILTTVTDIVGFVVFLGLGSLLLL